MTSAVDVFAPPRIEAERRADGAILLRSAEPLGEFAPSIAHLFRAGSEAHPDRVLAAQRPPGGAAWETLTWGEARRRADAIAQALAAIADRVPAAVVARAVAPGTLALADLEATEPLDDVERAFAGLGPDTVAKILLTSGSTGTPKGVVNTHRMLCSNQQALGRVWPFVRSEPPVLVDWLPWSHTFGANHNLGQVLAFGGTLNIDDGRTAAALYDRTVAAQRE